MCDGFGCAQGSGRRGTRKRVKPLEYWNNEMAVYNADGGMQEVIHREEFTEPSLSPEPKRQKVLN